jgi:CheY-like chemotaxis protein
MNLLLNAAEAIEEIGRVSISTVNQQVDTLLSEEKQIPLGYYLVVIVEDDGPGIKDDDIEHIFEPFYTKKKMGRSGTGLGLSVVWNTVQDHDGVVLVENMAHGTRFQLYFPVSTAKVLRLPEELETEVPLGHGEVILVVDDEPQLRDIATQILVALDYEVASVCSGELALKFLTSNNVDLIVLDMMMEPGLNGRQTYEKIIAENPEQKAIIASGFSDSDDVKAVLKMGAHGFIKKPYSIEQLGRAVKKALTATYGESNR